MRIEFLQPSDELIAVLASLEELLVGEVVVTDAVHVEAVSPRAMNIIGLLRDPVHKRPGNPDRFSAITQPTDMVVTDEVGQ